jgi:hypothetical protein
MHDDLTLRSLVARANSISHIMDLDAGKRQPRSREHRIVKAARALQAGLLPVLFELLDGERVLACVRGELYAVGGRPDCSWAVAHTDEPIEYTVLPDASSCTCPDSKYRGGVCKHVEAVMRILRPASGAEHEQGRP